MYKNNNSKMLYISNLLLIIDLFLIFCSTFVGDYTINNIPLFFVFWILIQCRRGFKLSRTELLIQVILLFIFAPIFLSYNKYAYTYYISSFYPAFYVNIIFFLKRKISLLTQNKIQTLLIVRWFPSIIIIFLSFLTYIMFSEGQRVSIIFGPNVYYRILGVLFLSQVIIQKICFRDTFSKLKKYISLFLLFIVFGMFAYLILSTGSRGATIVLILCFLYLINAIFQIKEKKIKYSLLSLFITIFFVMMLATNSNIIKDISDIVININSRAFTFYDVGESSSSIKLRNQYLGNFFTFFKKDNFLLGEGSDYIYSYPHNLYLDVLYNAGIFPFLCLVISTLLYIYCLIFKKLSLASTCITMNFLPLYLGGLVSGTLYDNYSIIAIIIFIPINTLFSVSKGKFNKLGAKYTS